MMEKIQSWSHDELESTEQRSSGSSPTRYAKPEVNPSEVVGFETYEAELEGWLLDNEFKNKVIFLVGMGGVGKTTLAGIVYNKPVVVRHYSCRAWITVSESFNPQKLLDSILMQFHQAKAKMSTTDSAPSQVAKLNNGDNDDNDDQELLRHKLLEYLEKERYMVVFDDVWDVSFCQLMKNIFPETKRGCTIVITTRVYKNLDIWWPPTFFVRFQELQPLAPEMALKLFCKKVFQAELQGLCLPPELEELSHRILERCGRLPASLVVVGQLLSTQEHNLASWQWFLDSFPLSQLLSSLTQILLPRHGYLPLKLEACFLYFGIYPKDYIVSRARLIRQWIAEGFVESEEMGDDYMSELVSLSLVQDSHTDTIDCKPRRCWILNIMHDIIRSVCTKTSGFRRRDELNEECSSAPEDEARYKSFTDSHIRPRFPFMVDLGHHDMPKPVMSSKWFANYKFLKMLDLEGSRDLICVPEEVGSLIFLTYLSVRNTTIMMLPKSIGNLQKLETLDLKYSLVCELPLEINTLGGLQHILSYYYGKRTEPHLNGIRGVKISEGFGHSEGLRKLYHIEANNDVGLMKELRKFSQLRKLGITNLTTETSRALCSSFENMYQLENLQLFSASEDEILDLQSLSFPSPIQRLCIEGRLESLPDCITRLQTLVTLTLSFSKLTYDPLEAIQYLVSLTKLQLYEAYDGEQLRFKDGTFQNLKVLTTRGLPRLNSVIIDEWTLPFLEEFSIGESPKLKEVPSGIKHLRALKTLKFYEMADDFGLSMVPNGGQHHCVVQHIPDVRFYYKCDGGKRFNVYPLR